MILGRDVHPESACFDEINAAIEAMTERTICFNAHSFPHLIPDGAIVYNLENVPRQVDPAIWKGREVWDFSSSNAAKYGARHVPIGYHPSMERFERAPAQDIDVVFSGVLSDRRKDVLDGIAERGYSVVYIPSIPGNYGENRDRILSRAKLALNILHHEDGVFPALRVAHLVANSVPVLSEECRGRWPFVQRVLRYEHLVDSACEMLASPTELVRVAENAYSQFRAMPMVLP